MTARHHSRLGALGLIRRQFSAAPTASILLALLVFAGALLATSVPRAIAAMHTAALGEDLGQYAARDLDVLTSTRNLPDLGASHGGSTLLPDVDAVWGAQEQHLTDIRAGMPELLRHVTGEPLSVLVAGPNTAVPSGSVTDPITYRLFTGFDPRLREHITLTGGEWPAPLADSAPNASPLEVVFADAVAEEMNWAVGEVRALTLGSDSLDVRLVGTFAATDPDDGFWTHVPVALEPSVGYTADDRLEVTGLGLADPVSWAALDLAPLPVAMDAWFPTYDERIRAEDAPELLTQLHEFTSRSFSLGDGMWEYSFATVGDVAFTSGLDEALEEALVAVSASSAVLATIVSGPIGVMVAVLVLGARVVFERRRTGLELAAARGGSIGQLRAVLALEGLAIGVPAAVVGGAMGTLLVDADAGAGGWAVAALFALTPTALLIAAAPALSPLRRVRADLGRTGSGRFRWIAEALVAVLAVTAGVLLLRRGLSTSTPSIGVDPLLAAVPLLLSLLACFVVLRLYPIPLTALVRRTARRADLVPFLGSARALRDPSAGLVPVLALVVGVSVAMFSTVLLGTVQAGVERAAHAQVGADASVSGPPITEAQLDEFIAVPGVEAIAPVYSTSPSKVEADGRTRSTTLIVIDAEQMRRVQAGRSGSTPLPAGLDSSDGDAVPVVVSRQIADLVGDADSAELDGDAFEVLAVVDGRTAYSPSAAWILMDRSNAEPFTSTLVPHTVLVRFEPGADAGAAITALAEIAGPAVVSTPDDLLAELRAKPFTQGLVVSLIVALLLASLLTALAIVLTFVVGRPARDRLLPLLSTLGLSRRSGRALVVWEVAPMALVALVAGALLGAGLPFIVFSGVDLRAFTNGDTAPAVTFDPWLISAVLAGGVLVTIVAAVVASRIGGVDAARAIRKEEEG